MILLVGGEKGGTGKTTIAVNLAAGLRLQGRDVLLVDTDPQGSASGWSSMREDRDDSTRVPCVQKFGKSLQREIKELDSRYQDVIVDAGGRDSVELRAALVAVEQVLIPVQASQFDLWTIERMSELVNSASAFNANLHATVILSRAPTNLQIQDTYAARDMLQGFENLTMSNIVIRDRIVYRRSVAQGGSVLEYQPVDRKAQAEITNLINEVIR